MPDKIKVGQKWRHVKRQTEYEIVHINAVLQVEDEQWDNCDVLVYRSLETGAVWVRPVEEFIDGRFVCIDAGEI